MPVQQAELRPISEAEGKIFEIVDVDIVDIKAAEEGKEAIFNLRDGSGKPCRFLSHEVVVFLEPVGPGLKVRIYRHHGILYFKVLTESFVSFAV